MWLVWIAILAAVSVYIMLNDQPSRGIGLLVFLSSLYVGILLGSLVGHFLGLALRLPAPVCARLSASLSAFGFLFLPSLVGTWTNAHLNTGIEIPSLVLVFLWACIGGGVFFSRQGARSQKVTSWA